MIKEELSTLNIHLLTQPQYKKALANGNINNNELYLTQEGLNTVAEGDYSYAGGKDTTARGEASVAFGINTETYAPGSSALGLDTCAGGKIFNIITGNSTADTDGLYELTLDSVEGISAVLSALASDESLYVSIKAEYNYDYIATIKSIDDTTNTIKIDNYVPEQHFDMVAGGILWIPGYPELGTTILPYPAHAEGYKTVAQNLMAHAEGYNTQATGKYSHAEGQGTKAGYNGHAEGKDTLTRGSSAHAEGAVTKAIGANSHAEGCESESIGINSHAEGHNTIAEGSGAHAEGTTTQAIGKYSHTEGDRAVAKGDCAHAEGTNTRAEGEASHAEGYLTSASGSKAHAEGSSTKATGTVSHAEGGGTTASGYASHAEGQNTIANGPSSHAGGQGAQAIRTGSFAHGEKVTTDAEYQTTFGRYNEAVSDALFIVGNGDDLHRSNAIEVSKQGDVFVQGNIYVQGTGDKKNTLNELVQKSQLNRLESTVTRLDTTLNAVAIDFITDENVAYKKVVPEDVLPYASITKVGGITYVDSERVVHPKVNNISLTSTQDLIELVPQNDLNLVSTEYSDRSVDISILDTKTIKIKGFNNISFYSDRYETSVTKYEFGPITNITSAVFPAGDYTINYSSIVENETSYLDVYLKYVGETINGSPVTIDTTYGTISILESFMLTDLYVCVKWSGISEHESRLESYEISDINVEFVPSLMCTTTESVIELPVENLPEEYCYGMGVTTSTQTYSNYIDLESKQFVKHCNTAELTGTYEGHDLPGGVIVINSNVLVDTLICLDPKLTIEQTSINENLLAVLLTAKSNDIENVLEYVKNMYNQGTPVKVLYAVKQPKIYDISELLTSVEDYIEVYPGDTLVFNNQEEVPVFSSIEYQTARKF